MGADRRRREQARMRQQAADEAKVQEIMRMHNMNPNDDWHACYEFNSRGCDNHQNCGWSHKYLVNEGNRGGYRRLPGIRERYLTGGYRPEFVESYCGGFHDNGRYRRRQSTMWNPTDW